ncbi:MAG: SLBB domain-containing protein, partial [Marinilabiliales bacterium]|nr:SLBB domain-containing protein [Marinilabiliales bacterium]
GTAKIFLKGLTLAQGREIINQRLSTAYTFRPDQFAVTIVTARTILVNIFGEVKITGGFNISALNSALNALAAAGGPTGIGSVRTIQHIRGSVKKNIDLYAFMSDPTVQYKYDLQQNDILYVPVANMLATIEGAVKRPMTYEMLPSESLVDLIKYAGNLTTNVLPDFVQIQRIINGEERLFEWNLADVMSGKLKVSLQNGDVVRIKESNKPMDQYVDIDGSVFYGGRYDLASNGTLQTLLANAKPMPRAKTDLVFVERMRKDETTELLSVPFPSNTNEQFKLFPRDKVHIQDLSAFRDVTTISVSGNVRNPFERSFALNDHITIKQALEWANGLKPSSFPVAYIFRHNPFKPAEIKYIQVDLNNSDNVLLQAGDQLKVYDNNTYTNIGEVRIYGAVKTPNGYTYDPTMSLQDLLVNSGGFSVGAAYNRIEVFRTEISPVEQVKMKLITVQVDSTYRLVSPLDFKLQPYDQVVVRMTPEFSLNRTIEVTGQVKYPGVYLLESKQTFLSDIVEKSGGLLDSADPEGSWLFRTYHKRGGITMSIRKAMENKGNAKFDPILFEGDVVNINRRENTVIIRQTGTMMSQYSINPENNGIKTVVFQGRKSARWYINHFAGGFDKEANKNSLTVTMPNDQMFATKKILFFRKYPTVRTGSVISLQMKPPKPVKIEENKKMDWQSFWATTLSATTALISILVLSRNL